MVPRKTYVGLGTVCSDLEISDACDRSRSPGGERLGPGVRFEKDAPVNHFSDWLLLTLGARDFSSALSGFCQAYGQRCVGLRLTTKIPTAREKNLWYPG